MSCVKTERSAISVIEDFKENGQAFYSTTSKSDSFIYELLYVPQEVLFLGHFNGKPTQKDLDSFLPHRNDMVSFQLTIKPSENYLFPPNKSLESHISVGKNVDYLTYRLKEDISIHFGKDSIMPAYYDYERLFGIRNEIRIHFGFTREKGINSNSYITILNKMISKLEYVKIPLNKKIEPQTYKIKI
ncbi:MAG: hypothetical protein IT244_13055 [Bacteroidia bacterium]|nr:hypothetical protein [Bacteroidia bacterium]